MDAAEADADVKLYKASRELLFDLQAKLPRLVKAPYGQPGYRKWVVSSKAYEVTRLLDAFQEWPQLLDPYLSSLVGMLVDAYLTYCTQSAHEYLRQHSVDDALIPLPRAIADVLYAFCKVRGQKIIVRLLNNEPKYVEPLLSCFRLWTSCPQPTIGDRASNMTWQERYIHLLWLSHLMLAPFELSTISGLSVDTNDERRSLEVYQNLPDVAVNLAMAGLDHLQLPSKAREAASILIVRLALRSDMHKLGFVEKIVRWIVREFHSREDRADSAGYYSIGLLELLFGIMNSASDSEAAPFLNDVFRLAYTAATSSDEHFQTIRDPAPARKLLVKLMRSTVVHAITIEAHTVTSDSDLDLNAMLEDCIQTLLDFLADKDTPVRQAASKALSLICLKLDAEMAAQVVEAVVDSLNENMLLEDIKDGRLFPITDVVKNASSNYKKNLNAVDPLKWHGCMLTLGHLLFRRSLPASQLPSVIEALLMGLEFEQRSNVGTSVGVGVRDAACFGVWSLARKYSTIEVGRTTTSATLIPYPLSFGGGLKSNTIQLVATHLAMSACLDPSGNLRRGSSAALQELIGRHPDVIAEGIPVVQTIDYHAVARRSRAITEVAIAASRLSGYYHGALLYGLLGWRGVRATDADSRRQTAEAIGILLSMTSTSDASQFVHELIAQINNLKSSNNGSNAAARHGLLCSLASVIESVSRNGKNETKAELLEIVKPLLQDIEACIGTVAGRVTIDIENVLEGISKVILAASGLISTIAKQSDGLSGTGFSDQWSSSVNPILERCTISSDKESVTDVAAQANIAVLRLLKSPAQVTMISSWMNQERQGRKNFTCKGLIATLGQAYAFVRSVPDFDHFANDIVMYMSKIVRSSYPMDSKVNAMQSIKTILATDPKLGERSPEILTETVIAGLMDYTIDNRGDVGSLLRLEAIETATQLLVKNIDMARKRQMSQLLVKLAAEKLIKVRFQAWLCLQEHLKTEGIVTRKFDHQTDVSSFEYFRNLLVLLAHPHYCEPLLLGLVSCIAGATEEVSRACSEAFIAYMQDQDMSAQQSLAESTIQIVVKYLMNNANADDRETIPAVDFFAFLFEQVIASQSNLSTRIKPDQIWKMCQKVHIANSTIGRLEAMIRLYSSLAVLDLFRMGALERLTRLLLHRWPKVRGAAADAIFLCTATQPLPISDWNIPAVDNKSAVLTLRKDLGVAGPAAAKPPLSTAIAT